MNSALSVSDPSVSTPAANTARAASSPAPATSSSAAAPQNTPNADPLILAATLVWLSIDLIGDGLLALRALLANLTRERTVTPS